MSWKPKLPPHAAHKKHVFEKAGEVSRFVYQIGESDILRKPSQEVLVENISSKEFKSKVAYLKKSLLKYRKITGYGRGISAVQVGIPERFSVIYTPEKLHIIINPKITSTSLTLLAYPEICMSANPIIVPTIRPSWVEFDYYNEDGDLKQWDTKDETDTGKIMNRIFLHEIDHMEGIINLDKIQNPKQLMLESDPDFYKNARFEEVT